MPEPQHISTKWLDHYAISRQHSPSGVLLDECRLNETSDMSFDPVIGLTTSLWCKDFWGFESHLFALEGPMKKHSVIPILSLVAALGSGPSFAQTDIRSLQEALVVVGCYGGPVNGVIEDGNWYDMQLAVTCFQRHVDERRTGELTSEQQTSVFAMAAAGAQVDNPLYPTLAQEDLGDDLTAFEMAAPLDGRSDVVLDRFGFEIAHGPGGFVLGGYNLLQAGPLPRRFETGAVLGSVVLWFQNGPDASCTDMACVEGAIDNGAYRIVIDSQALDARTQEDDLFPIALSDRTYAATTFERNRQIAYSALGLLLPAEQGSTILVEVAPGSPAYLAGLRAGHELQRVNDRVSSPVNMLAEIERAVREGRATALFYRTDPAIRRDEEGGAVPAFGRLAMVDGIVTVSSGGSDGPAMSTAFGRLTDDNGLMALVLGRPELAPEAERCEAALRVLEGWSFGTASRQCLEPPLSQFGVSTTLTEVTRNGFGVEVMRETTSSVDTLFVEQQFEAFVLSMGSAVSSPETAGPVARAAFEMVQLHGCQSDEYRYLRAQIMDLVGIGDGQGWEPNADLSGNDWRSFVATCFPATMQNLRNEGVNPAERPVAGNCVCAQAAATDYGNVEVYDMLSVGNWRLVSPQDMEEINQRYAEICPRGEPMRADIEERYEQFLIYNAL